MVERICPQCQQGNSLENRFCGQCGATLERNQLVPRQETSITIAGRDIPMQQIKQVGQTVALSLAALAAEAGMAWLRRRVTQINMPPVAQQQIVPTQTQPTRSIVPSTTASNVVTIISQRVVEVWEQGNMTKQTVERHVWRREG